MENMPEELIELIPIMKKAGEEVLKIYSKDFKIYTKHDNSPVTDADLLVEKILLENLKKFDYGLISEETPREDVRFEKEKIWVIDPIDGTKGFINKTDDFSIMLGLLKRTNNGEYLPEIGIIYLPVEDTFYYAAKNKGSYKQKGDQIIKLEVSKKKDIEDFTLLISRNHFNSIDEKICKEINIKNFIKVGSIGIKLAYIAEGKAELYFNTSKYLGEWDVCGPALILSEAGGEVFDIHNNELIFNSKNNKMEKGIIASNKTNHKKISQIISNIVNKTKNS